MARILLVDDDPGTLHVLQTALEAAGHDVCTADGLDCALELAPLHAPELVIVDVMMPNGTEDFRLVWRIRQSPLDELRNVPIILASSIHEHTELRFYPERSDGTYKPGDLLPIQGLLDKPVKPVELLAAVEAVLVGKGLRGGGR